MTSSLQELFELQRNAFARGAPGYETRIAALTTLGDALDTHRDELVRTVAEDFGGRPREETLLLELFPLRQQIHNARRRLRTWMRPRRVAPAWFLLPAGARVMYQPLGVVGVIGAWNYQLLLSLSPVVGALAAGNHVIVKPSEVMPRTAEAITRIIGEQFPRHYVAAINGGPEAAAALSTLPLDHLVFTGSAPVGRAVLRAASEHLTPVTLELGGKSPAIVHADYPPHRAAARIATGKLFNAGQTCVAPDYVLVARGRVEAFVGALQTAIQARYRSFVFNSDYTRIVSARHWRRLDALVADARARGGDVRVVNPASESFSEHNKVFPPTLVVDPPHDAGVMQEELFGPVLPIVPYETLDGALAYVNARPRPLALYYFDDSRWRVQHVLAHTISGGVTVNDVVLHLAQDNIPFGGVGQSGMGHYHGFDGFERFSKKKGIMLQSRWTPMDLFRPPYTSRTRSRLARLMRL
jgi:coniferyl-aldehyde dehydrogenase